LAASLAEEHQKPPGPDQTLAHLGGQIVPAAEAPQNVLEVAAGARSAGLPEHVVRDLVDFEPDALEHVRHPIDQGVEQPGQHRVAAPIRPGRALAAGSEQRERLRLGVAHRDQAVARQNEGDRGRLRMLRLGLGDDGVGHVQSAVLLVQAARELDLLHLLPGRDPDVEQALDPALFVVGRRYQVEPDRLSGQ
jgi:hypothetical protein